MNVRFYCCVPQDEIEEVDMDIDDDSDQEIKDGRPSVGAGSPSAALTPRAITAVNIKSTDHRSTVQSNGENGTRENSRDNSDDLTDLAERMSGNFQGNCSGGGGSGSSSDPIEVSAAKDVDLRIRYAHLLITSLLSCYPGFSSLHAKHTSYA